MAGILLPSEALPATLESDYQVKAAYLYHFARFVEWPAEAAGAPLTISVIGKAPASFAAALAGISGKTVRNRRLVINFVDRVEDLQGCDILFVTGVEKGRVEHILASVASRPILTVSDLSRFVATGGMIGFVPGNDKVRFAINQRVSQRSGLRISAQLLKLATTVVE